MAGVPSVRVSTANRRPVDPGGEFVLYWCTAFRRTRFNFALERALEHAVRLGKPLVVLEALRCDYPWASDRLHRFVAQGMADNARALAATGVAYHAYVEPTVGAGKGLLGVLGERACVVVGDDYPCFFLPRMTAAAASRLPVRLEVVDSNGIFAMRSTDRCFTVAHSFRRHLQREIVEDLDAFPREDPLEGVRLPPAAVPEDVLRRWPAADLTALLAQGGLAALPIDHTVGPTRAHGGAVAGGSVLERFLADRADAYGTTRNDPDDGGGSGLSPYLHFGHVASHEVFLRVTGRQDWDVERVRGRKPNGRRNGWWQLPESAEAFLDQLVTWRELGFNGCVTEPGYDRYETLPGWALETLEAHAGDVRPRIHSVEELAAAGTADAVWNAAQRELVLEGRIHNYLRMLWGKRVLEWTAHPREALAALIELNNRYALDGRDPNSYSGIAWVLGRHDRAWGPERPIFGKVRYMSSAAARRKLRMRRYLERHGP